MDRLVVAGDGDPGSMRAWQERPGWWLHRQLETVRLHLGGLNQDIPSISGI